MGRLVELGLLRPCGPRKQMKSIENWLVLFYWLGAGAIQLQFLFNFFNYWRNERNEVNERSEPRSSTNKLINHKWKFFQSTQSISFNFVDELMVDEISFCWLIEFCWRAALPPIPFLNFIQLFNSFAELKELMKWDGMAFLHQRQRWFANWSNKFNFIKFLFFNWFHSFTAIIYFYFIKIKVKLFFFEEGRC